MRHTQNRSPALERLESRVLFYATTGLAWANHDITYSFMPDGTSIDATNSSRLFAQLNAVASPDVWQREFTRALQTWGQYAPLNFQLVSDDGSPRNVWGLVQSDPRFGDIRLGSEPLGYALAATYGPNGAGAVEGGTGPGELLLNSDYGFHIGSNYDFYSVLLHEVGHALGLGHGDAGTVMYGTYSGIKSGLSADDIAGIQAIYGVRVASATPPATPAGFSATAISSNEIDLTWTDVTGETGYVVERSITGSVWSQVAALAPDCTRYADVGLPGGSTYFYRLTACGNSGTSSATSPATATTLASPIAPIAPTNLLASSYGKNKIKLSWTGVSSASGYVIQRSLDGKTWTTITKTSGTATSYIDASRKRGTRYFYRVAAYNDGGTSPYSGMVSIVA